MCPSLPPVCSNSGVLATNEPGRMYDYRPVPDGLYAKAVRISEVCRRRCAAGCWSSPGPGGAGYCPVDSDRVWIVRVPGGEGPIARIVVELALRGMKHRPTLVGAVSLWGWPVWVSLVQPSISHTIGRKPKRNTVQLHVNQHQCRHVRRRVAAGDPPHRPGSGVESRGRAWPASSSRCVAAGIWLTSRRCGLAAGLAGVGFFGVALDLPHNRA